MSKFDRKNHAKQLRQAHQQRREKETSIFEGRDAAPKHVVVLQLSPKADSHKAILQLNDSIDTQGTMSADGCTRVLVDRFRRKLCYIPSSPNLLEALDKCQLADWVVLVFHADPELGQEQDTLLRAIEGQGITNVSAVVQGIDSSLKASRKSQLLAGLKADVSIYFPTLEKLSDLENASDCANLARSLCTATTKGIRWRDERSWMLLENITWPETSASETDVILQGIVRGRNLNPDRLVHVPGWGDFQISKIQATSFANVKRKADEMSTDDSPVEYLPTSNQDDLAVLAPEAADMDGDRTTTASTMQKGVLLDDHHYFSDDESHIPAAPKKLPKGTSSYQAAWYLEDVSDTESDIMDDDDDGDGDSTMNLGAALAPEDGGIVSADVMTEAAQSEYPQSEMNIDDEQENEGLEEYRTSRKREAEEDLEFPDEIELPPNVLARERLAKYRGLKSLRTSEWNTEADAPYEPVEYTRLLKVADYKKSRSTVLKESLVGGVSTGTRAEVVLKAVPTCFRYTKPHAMFSLLRHEHKNTVVNLSMTLSSGLAKPIRSKDEIIVQIGSRRLAIKPIFSAAGITPNDVHKFDRYLHPGRTGVASFTGPVTWGSVPVLVFRKSLQSSEYVPKLVDKMVTYDTPQAADNRLELIGTATITPPSNSRVIAKRVILTGHPYKIHKKLVTIRYMFFNTDDVAWFSALPLWTKRGRQGFIKESLGTHGYFKATFDAKINPMDAVGVSLYKRVWPRAAEAWIPDA